MKKTTLYPYTKKSTFSTTSALNGDSNVLARVEALRRELETKNTAAKEGRVGLERAQAELSSVSDNLAALVSKSQDEKGSMATFLQHFGAVMKPEDKLTADKLLSNSKKVEELFNTKISQEASKEDSSLLKLIKLQSTKEKLTHEAEDKVESLINSTVEKGISNKELDLPFQSGYLVARALRLKERNEFKAEEKKVYSESTSRLSPVDHIVEKMECAEPEYTDIDE